MQLGHNMQTMSLVVTGLNTVKHRSSGVVYNNVHFRNPQGVVQALPVPISLIVSSSIDIEVTDPCLSPGESTLNKLKTAVYASSERIVNMSLCPLCNRPLLILDEDHVCTNICCQSAGMVAEGLYHLCPRTSNGIIPLLDRYPEMYSLPVSELFDTFHKKLTSMDPDIAPYVGVMRDYMQEFCSLTLTEFLTRSTDRLSSIDISVVALTLNDSMTNLYFRVSNNQMDIFDVNTSNILSTIVNNNMELLGALVRYRLLYR